MSGFLFAPGYLARSTISTTRQLTVLARGRVSMIRTTSPALAPSSLRALSAVLRVIRFP
jgi:hypothetical protein